MSTLVQTAHFVRLVQEISLLVRQVSFANLLTTQLSKEYVLKDIIVLWELEILNNVGQPMSVQKDHHLLLQVVKQLRTVYQGSIYL